jgi:hypothetical protein
MPSRNGKKSEVKGKIYCYTWEGGEEDWTLFTPKHEDAGVKTSGELELQLMRVKTFRKRADKILCVSMRGKAPEIMADLGADPAPTKLKKFKARVHRLIEL